MAHTIQILDRELLADITGLAETLGRCPTLAEVNARCGAKRHELYRSRFGGFHKACGLVGLTCTGPNTKEVTITDEEIVQAYTRIRKRVHGMPTENQWRKYRREGEPCNTTCKNRWGRGRWADFIGSMEVLAPPYSIFS